MYLSFRQNKTPTINKRAFLILGISRLQRWERAKVHNLNPPEDVKELLLKTQSDPSYSHR